MSQLAWILKEKFGTPKVANRPIPKPKDDQVLVKITAAAFNPVECVIADLGLIVAEEDNQYPTVLGCDGAGIVESTGSAVSGIKSGDAVFFLGQIGNADASCLQQYAVVPYDLMAKVPKNIAIEEACTLPVAATASVTGFYHESGFNLTPFWEAGGRGKYAADSILVVAGSSSTGQLAIQFAKLSGMTVYATASDAHASFLQSLGASKVFPRTATGDEIKKTVNKPIKFAFVSVANEETEALALSVLEKKEGSVAYCTWPPWPTERKEGMVTVKSGLGSSYVYPDIGRKFWANIEKYLAEGAIKPNRVELLPGGLASASEALDRLRQNKVSGVKLVVKPDQTKV